MSKERLSALLKEVSTLDPSRRLNLSIEDAGLLQAFLNANAKAEDLSAGVAALVTKVRDLLTVWEETRKELPADDRDDTERRTQLELREAIDKLKGGHFEQLTANEIALLRGTLERLTSCQDGGERTLRLINILSEGFTALDEHLAEAGVTADAPLAEHDLDADAYFSSEDRQSVKTLAGIKTDLIVTAYELTGNVRVRGDIPQDVLLTVRAGALTVDGFVFGSVLVRGDITISENVQGGWVISSKGDVSMRGVLTGAKVIAQSGRVSCSGMESPELVFGRDGVQVQGDVNGGKLVSRAIKVDGKVNSAELHAVDAIDARAFESGRAQNTVICLRSALTCEDYGRALDEAAVALRQKVSKGTYHTSILWSMVHYTQLDVFDCYRSMLYYLLGGVDSRSAISRLRGAQSLAIYLDYILSAGKTFVECAHEVHGDEKPPAPVEVSGVSDECLNALFTIERGVRTIPDEFGINFKQKLIRAVYKLKSKVARIKKAAGEGRDVLASLAALKGFLVEGDIELGRAQAEAKALVDGLGIGSELGQKIETEPDKLKEFLAHSMEEALRSTPSRQATRARSAFMGLMRRLVSLHQTNIDHWGKELAGEQEILEQSYQQLESEASAVFGSREGAGVSVRGGYFDEGVVLTTSPSNTTGPDADEGPVICLGNPVLVDTAFTLYGPVIKREKLSPAS